MKKQKNVGLFIGCVLFLTSPVFAVNSKTPFAGVLTLSCPNGSNTVTSTQQMPVPDVTGSVTASTTCPGGVVTKTQSPAAGSPLTPGVNVITITATDNCGNSQTCTQTITYNHVTSNSNPITINCPGNQTITSTQQTTVPNIASATSASTTCAGGIVSKTQSPAVGASLHSGSNAIVVTATDNCGNTQSCVTIINYQVISNTGVLHLVCPGGQVVTSAQQAFVPNVAGAANASTTCPGGVVTKTQSPTVGTPLHSGANIITVTATDNCGNTQTCSKTIIYHNVAHLSTLNITFPDNQEIKSSEQTTLPDLGSVTSASSTCAGPVTITQIPAAGAPMKNGENTVTIVATDDCQNTVKHQCTITYDGFAGMPNLSQINGISLYPNPTKTDVTVNYALKSDGFVTIYITDINGKTIATLINEKAEVGNYSRRMNLNTIEKGVYFVRFQLNGSEVFEKLVVE